MQHLCNHLCNHTQTIGSVQTFESRPVVEAFSAARSLYMDQGMLCRFFLRRPVLVTRLGMNRGKVGIRRPVRANRHVSMPTKSGETREETT